MLVPLILKLISLKEAARTSAFSSPDLSWSGFLFLVSPKSVERGGRGRIGKKRGERQSRSRKENSESSGVFRERQEMGFWH